MIIALLLALGIGLSLGLLGGGGSIITLPVLVYAARVPAGQAVGMSLAIVGGTTLVASILNARQGQVNLKAAVLFSLAGIIGALIGSQLTHRVSPSILLLLFAGLMILVGVLMLRKRASAAFSGSGECHWLSCAVSGLGVGILTGFLGVGGGFLIVPALLFFARLTMKQAIATSLVVITASSAAGLLGQLQRSHFDWRIAGLFLAFAIAGMFAGRKFAAQLEAELLRHWFAWFVLAVAVFVIAQNWRTLF